MKNLFLICLLAMVLAQQVQYTNRCNDCGQLKSQNDCEQEVSVTGACEWVAASGTTAAKCQKKTTVDPVASFKPYCELVDKPETNCAKTLGCAYVESKCTHFTGCPAYVKTTTTDCQAISYFCVSDGNSCIEAKECKAYTQQQCESTPSISGILKCKWDTTAGACRDYACSEADVTLNTDAKCSSWLAGCVTKGQGCVNAPRPACATYTGDDAACQSFIGSDGNCELATGTTNCKAKECANAPTSLASDDDCKAYQRGCITTGKRMCFWQQQNHYVQPIQVITLHVLDILDQMEFVKVMLEVLNVEQENVKMVHSILMIFANNIKAVVKQTEKHVCQLYQLVIHIKELPTTCAVYIGTDGYCKGTSTTTEAACAPKVCDEAPDTTTTDDACAKYQVGCVTTGKGCVTKTNLKSCTTYDGDTTSCQSRVGTEGKCTWKSGTKCVARDCASAASNVNTNPLCANYFTNCVTTGSGCVSQTTCDATVKQQSCEGTNNCSWQPICTSNTQCSDFKKKSICLANQARIKTFDKNDENGNPLYIYVTGKCGWLNNACKDLACSDLTGAYYNTDANCAAELSTCISNRVDACITKYDCGKLVGTQSTCLSYPGYCTNVASATDTTPCVSRKCADNTDATDNATCATFLPGCISSGKGCVDYNTPCSSMKGTQENCNKLFAYKNGSSTNFTTNQCYNSASATDSDFCKVKTCKLAENQTDGSCGSFLDGCVYNGNGGCVDPKAGDTTCGSYTGVAAFCESAIVGSNSSKYCFGTSTSGACTTRACTDNTTATKDEDCEAFLTGCIAKSEGGCAAKSARVCSAQQGTVATCPNFSGGLSPSWTKVGCTRYDTCADRVCSDKASPQLYNQLVDSQRLDLHALMQVFVLVTLPLILPHLINKSLIIVQLSKIALGMFVVGPQEQSVRTFTTSLTCVAYLQKGVSSAASTDTCKLAGTFCYLPNKSDCTYAFPTGIDTDAKKLTQCQKYVNTDGVFCSFKTGEATCTQQSTCEKVVSQTTAQACNDVLAYGSGICQKASNTGCLSTVAACTSYTLDSSLSDANKKTACESLKVVNNISNFGAGTATYTGCTWSTGNTCAALACSAITSATSQKDCDSKTAGCYYYSGKCYASVAACPTSFPADLDTDTKKAIYCKSIFKTGDAYCEIKPDGSGCQAGTVTACASVAIATSWSGSNFDGAAKTTDTFCITQSIKNKTKYCIKDDNAKCKDGTCEDITGAASQGDCDIHLIGCVFSANKCRTPKGVVTGAGDCASLAKVPFSDVASLAGSAKTAYCQVFSQDGASVFCTYDEFHATTQTACVAAGNCDSYTVPDGDAARSTYCNSKINATGKKCTFTAGDSKCRDFDCKDISSPTSQVDCDISSNKLKCIYFKGTCVNKELACAKVPAVGTTADDKRSYCSNITVSEACTYAVGAYCVKEDACSTYDVTDATDKLAACKALADASDKQCTFVNGTKCAVVGACSSYTPAAGSEATQCKSVKSNDDYPCIVDSSAAQKCQAQVCTDNDASATDCVNNAANCLYYSSKCIAKTTCGAYAVQGADDTAKQAWCEGVLNSSGDLCAWDAGAGKCKDRTCGDKTFYTDFDCSSYLKSCKTNGQACVAATTACNTINGSTEFCNLLLDGSGKDKCKLTATVSTTPAACTNKKCYDNVTATSDSECDSYLSGCVTRGTGCIPNSEPCTSYRGTKQQCEQFKKYIGLDANKNPIYEYCSGDATNTATAKCKPRTCADNTTASSDTDCAAYLKGCITKGTGCIDATSQCGGFKGDQATCAKFLGSSGKDYCWNTSTALATATCAKKKCSDIAGKNNKDCNDGMLPFKTTDDPFCVFDGTGCIDYGKNCSTFNGTEETCPNYLAKDGPCKATTVGTIKGACAKRVCTEAPNTLATDADCQKYHKDCVTTGYGCTATKNCKTRMHMGPNQCTASITTCATYNNTSYSQCTNSKVNGKFCAWTESNSTCRAQVCEDQPATIASHAQCQSFADNCTTSGAGCLTITTCPSYKTQSICIAASTTKDGVGRCGWDTATNKCRSRVCGDKNGLTDDECNTFLSGCKTNGSSCVAGTSCTEFSNKLFCIKSNFGPCLWVNGQCYDYDRCEDAIKKTHTECQGFSPLCTTNGDTCIPITNCASTTLKASCVVGTDGACGWLPTGKCQKFGQCTDAVAATNDECLSYGPTCITDGTACIAKAACGTYKTQTACNNLGTDGICYWNATANTCKLKECGDEQKGTNDQCKLISVTGGSCTTDGTKCIPLAACSSYELTENVLSHYQLELLQEQRHADKSNVKISLEEHQMLIVWVLLQERIVFPMELVALPRLLAQLIRPSHHVTEVVQKTINQLFVLSLLLELTKLMEHARPSPHVPMLPKTNWLAQPTKHADGLKNSTGTTCANHACDTFATGTDCQPIPSFDGASSTVCVLQSGKCAAADPGTMTDSKICYTKSAYTYSWNAATNKCESCISGSVNPNNSNGTNNNTDNGTTTTDSAYILSVISLGLLGLMA
ncbi:unnamed protein product (macronuclear) [Paramecium tetraurelia]|uniref:Uncharacterized protein n=1 Tax=Paramecium tetraurelia TaxID=5888 RepID=A0BTQ5_PARTE|nr:uncharacterized protein GSPATT00032154001 [Paramecium tetraurelia]CAK61922.1 unnamed protein product [Paramecium tetraurelia]|eukprot:XP_001429320.1 hypothetical protein (macronuclear) [Paramecium tetraurelia strain d4-2]